MMKVHVFKNIQIKNIKKYIGKNIEIIYWDKDSIKKFISKNKLGKETKDLIITKLYIMYFYGGLLIDEDFVFVNRLNDIMKLPNFFCEEKRKKISENILFFSKQND